MDAKSSADKAADAAKDASKAADTSKGSAMDAKDAAKQLKKLGSPVENEKSTDAQPFAPVFEGPRAAEIVGTMRRGLSAENAGRYGEARSGSTIS